MIVCHCLQICDVAGSQLANASWLPKPCTGQGTLHNKTYLFLLSRLQWRLGLLVIWRHVSTWETVKRLFVAWKRELLYKHHSTLSPRHSCTIFLFLFQNGDWHIWRHAKRRSRDEWQQYSPMRKSNSLDESTILLSHFLAEVKYTYHQVFLLFAYEKHDVKKSM